MILRLEQITKSYHNIDSGRERVILKGIDLDINKGDSIAIVGPSGCGKSTLLNIMGSMDGPTSGKIIFQDKDFSQLDNDQLAQVRNKQIGFVFQQHHLLPQLTLLENVMIPLMEEKDKTVKNAAFQNARDLLDKVGLSALISQYPGQLSVGECQRTALVRALINSPAILLADEPTGSLDEDSAKNLVDLLLTINKERKLAVVMVTHAQDLATKMDKQFSLSKGKLMELV